MRGVEGDVTHGAEGFLGGFAGPPLEKGVLKGEEEDRAGCDEKPKAV
jgi:hypothetical protein